MASDSDGTILFRLKTRQAWQWPEWLTAEWIAMDEGGAWFAYDIEIHVVMLMVQWTLANVAWEPKKRSALAYHIPTTTMHRLDEIKTP